MSRFRRTFILATLIGLSIGFVLQRARAPRLAEVGTGFPYEQRLESLAPRAGGERLAGRVVDETGAGVAGVGVAAVGPAGIRSVWSDGDGDFALEGLVEGTHEVHLISLDRPGATRTVEVPSATALELELGAPWPGLDTLPRLVRAPLAGTIDSAPTGGGAGYEVLLTPEDPPEVAGLAGLVERRVLVRSDGTFAVDDLAVGTYRASLLPPWAVGGSWPKLITTGLVHGEDGSELRLPGTCANVFGRVVDLDQRALAGALVSLRSRTEPTKRWPSVETGSDGRFRVGDLPGDDSYEITITAGRAQFVETLRVPALRPVEIRVPPLDPATAR